MHIDVTYIENTTCENKQEKCLDIFNLFDKDIINYYDIRFYLTNYNGVKYPQNDSILWGDCSD